MSSILFVSPQVLPSSLIPFPAYIFTYNTVVLSKSGFDPPIRFHPNSISLLTLFNILQNIFAVNSFNTPGISKVSEIHFLK